MENKYVSKTGIFSVSIGIPAYNEEKNIGHLVLSLLSQRLPHVRLEKIIVCSDGSTDNTVKIVQSVTDPRIEIISRKKRGGIMTTQNEIVSRIKSDILVMVDADILPANQHFLEEIVKPFLSDKKVGIVGADTVCAPAHNFTEKIISFSHMFKKDIYRKLKNGNNIYLCHGRARAMSKQFYSKLRWIDNYPEDSFSYLFCISNNFLFQYAPNAQVVFRSPSTVIEHAKQSIRFFHGKKILEKYYPKELVQREYKIPPVLLITSSIKSFIKHPIMMLGYTLITIWIKNFVAIGTINHSFHKISLSTKKIL